MNVYKQYKFYVHKDILILIYLHIGKIVHKIEKKQKHFIKHYYEFKRQILTLCKVSLQRVRGPLDNEVLVI